MLPRHANVSALLLCKGLARVAKGGQTKRALGLLQVVKDKGLPVDSYCYTAVIDGKRHDDGKS